MKPKSLQEIGVENMEDANIRAIAKAYAEPIFQAWADKTRALEQRVDLLEKYILAFDAKQKMQPKKSQENTNE